MLQDVDIVRMAAGANSVTVLSSGDGVSIQTPGASIQVTGAGEISVDGGEPVSKAELEAALAVPVGTLASGQTAELKDRGVYSLSATADAGFNLSGVTLATQVAGGFTTAHIVITLSGTGHAGAQTMPTANWVNTADGSAPVLDGGRVHYIALQKYGTYVNAHVSHSNPI